ncbi:MAG TPA: glycerate kinase [Chthoniobacterales bacterium]|nr:glycerate kinase [Chthoniobacterales bacterium]
MRILIAPDKFKGSLEAGEVAFGIAAGLRDVLPDAIIDLMPVADGGEGTAAVIREACGGEWVNCAAHDALGRPIEARYLWLPDLDTAVIEMSEAAGSRRLADSERDLLRADTCGVGEMIRDAMKRGAREVVLGLGGSATNDGGFGMARALGFRFLGAAKELTDGPGDLLNLTKIIPAEPPAIQITAAADVKNPLLGARGATRTFGPQKGGAAEQLDVLESGLSRLADVVRRDLGCDFRDTPGAGAAGGLGFGLLSFCGATLRSGFDLVAEILGLEAAIERADIVITGEGCLDRQTLEGKAPAGVAQLARKMGKRVFAIAGCATGEETVEKIFDGVFLLATPPVSREEAMARAKDLLRVRGQQLARDL